MTGNGPYFVSPSLINPTDGRGAEYGSTFAGEMFSNPGPGIGRRYPTPNVHRALAAILGHVREESFPPLRTLHPRPALRLLQLPEPSDVLYPAEHPGDYGSVTNNNINNTTFGKLSSMNYNPRQIQIGAYFRF